MAALVRAFRRTVISSQSRSLIQLLHSPLHEILTCEFNSHIQTPQFQSRNYVSEMRRKAFDDNVLRLLRNEVQYELDRSPPQQMTTEVNGFTVDERPGEQWVRLEKKFGDNEEIKVEVTMFDGSVPVSKYVDGKSGELGEEEIMHITLIVSIFKDDNEKVLEFMCSAWPNDVEIDKIYMRPRGQMLSEPYLGPLFKELDDELQELLYEFLEIRGIDDALCGFLHKYVANKDKTEKVRWMNNTASFIKEKVA